MSIDSLQSKLGGWRFRHYQTRKEIIEERDDLLAARNRLRNMVKEQEEYIFDLEVTLGVIAEIAKPTDKE